MRYIAERHAIAFRYHMEDPTTVRDSVAGKQRALNPFRPSEAHSPPDEEPPVEEACVLDVLLRRYVTYCARRRRFAQMNGTACVSSPHR